MSEGTIALSGLSDADAAAFEAAVDALAGEAWQLVNAAPATLLVVDIDTVWGHMDWLRATANGQQVVALTREAQVRNCELVLHKPLRAKDLAGLLAGLAGAGGADPAAPPRGAREATSASPAPAAPVPPIPAPSAAAPAVATAEPPTELTLGACLLAGGVTHPMTIRDAAGVTLTLDPERGGYTGSSLLKPLKPLLRMPMTQATALDGAAIERMRRAPALPLTRLLWFAAMSTQPGQLSPALDRQAHYHLARWPEIEREFPRHFRIATAMMRGPGTLDEIAASANAPVGDVADFINAYSVAGYVSCSGATTGDVPAASGGMFSRLRRPFTRGGPDSP